MLFLACRSVRNSLLKILVNVLGPQTWPPSEKKPSKFWNVASRLGFFLASGNGKEASPTIFHYFLGCIWPPQPLRTSKKKFGEAPEFFKNGTPKCPFFGVASLGSETPSLDSETQKRLVFLGLKQKQIVFGQATEQAFKKRRGTFSQYEQGDTHKALIQRARMKLVLRKGNSHPRRLGRYLVF